MVIELFWNNVLNSNSEKCYYLEPLSRRVVLWAYQESDLESAVRRSPYRNGDSTMHNFAP